MNKQTDKQTDKQRKEATLKRRPDETAAAYSERWLGEKEAKGELYPEEEAAERFERLVGGLISPLPGTGLNKRSSKSS